MFTLGLIYIYLYIYIFLSLLLLSFSFLPLSILTNWSISLYFVFLQKYTNLKSLFFFLIFALTGLPPVGLFFIKLNILVFILYQTHLFLIFILFLIFLLNIFFYIQLFNIKNFKISVYSNLSSDIFKNWNLNKNSINLYSYKHINFIVLTLSIIFLIIFFYSDIFLLLNL